MEWILLGIVLLLVLGAITLAVNAVSGAWSAVRFVTGRRRTEWATRLPQPRCLRCHGTGWVDREPERTFNFVGDSFEDKHSPATICPICNGTGVAPDRGTP